MKVCVCVCVCDCRNNIYSRWLMNSWMTLLLARPSTPLYNCALPAITDVQYTVVQKDTKLLKILSVLDSAINVQ